MGPGTGARKRLVLTDFDGTLSLTDVGYEVLLRFSGRGWDKIDRAYCAGEIGSREAYSRILGILGGSREEMLRFVDERTVLDPHFADFYGFCRERAVEVRIVSDGLDFYIDHVLRKFGLGRIPFYSNVLTFSGGRPVSVDFPHANEDCSRCGTCKSNLLRAGQGDFDEVIYVGDGYSDFCPAQKADLVFAKGILWDKLRDAPRDRVFPFSSFRDVKEVLTRNGYFPP